MTPGHLYLDHASTTPVDPGVVEAMRPYFAGTFGNPSSIHWFGRQARAALEEARAVVARAVGAAPGEIVYTATGTEADNLGILGAALAGARHGRRRAITNAAEHHAVLDAVRSLVAWGQEPVVLSVDGDARVAPTALEDALAVPTSVVSVMHANNEVGSLNALRTLADIAHAHGALMHADAVQSFGKVPVSVQDLGVDLLTISAHKLYGPKGIGALYIRHGTQIDPLFHGGGQEWGRRPGTESVALAVGFAKAVQCALERMEDERVRLSALRDELERRIVSEFPRARVNAAQGERLPHLSSISFAGQGPAADGEMLVAGMDLEGVAVSSGSACTSGSIQPSHVLLAMGRDASTARSTLRFSFGRQNGPGDLDRVLAALRVVLARQQPR